MSSKRAAKPVGRPRLFQADEALDRAMHIFWEKGFEGASVADLAAATGMRPASLYAAFGNKEALFGKAMERYLSGPAAFLRQALEEPTASQVTERILREMADFLTHRDHPSGCLMIQTLSCGEEARPVQHLLADLRRNSQEALRERFDRARTAGDLPASADPADLARFVTAVIQGMVIQAVGGATRDELLSVVETALRAWPQ